MSRRVVEFSNKKFEVDLSMIQEQTRSVEFGNEMVSR